MALIPDYALKSVVAIGDLQADGTSRWIASGFFYGRRLVQLGPDRYRYRTYLVTNRHVHSALTNPVVRANPGGDVPATEHTIDLTDNTGKPIWVDHPDPSVDVAVAGVRMEEMRASGYEVDFVQDLTAATVAQMDGEGIQEGDSVFLMGFPMGLVGEVRSATIVRGGTLARFRDLRNGYSKTMLVDGYVYPGNSGGPVFTRPELVSIPPTTAVASSFLIGVVASYVPYQDVAISPQTQRVRVIFEENSGLTQVFPMDCVNEAIDVYESIHPAHTDASPTEDAAELGPAAAESQQEA